MNIPASISGKIPTTTPQVAVEGQNVVPAPKNDAFRKGLSVSHSSLNGVGDISSMNDGLDLHMGELGKLFDKAFFFPAPPMPDFLKGA